MVQAVPRAFILFASAVLCAVACSAAGDGPREVQLRPADELRDNLGGRELLGDAGSEPGDAGVLPGAATL